MKILLISDIHANFPALKAVLKHFENITFDTIINCGDSLVYAPFPNETLHWLSNNSVHSILGNTDRKIIKLLKGKTLKKPSRADKRIMYTWTASQLDAKSRKYLLSLKKSSRLEVGGYSLGLFHGSPEDPDEFLFPDTLPARFGKLAGIAAADIIVTGHSHCPYHVEIKSHHFINPGSIGRMFDSNPAASCAVLNITGSGVASEFYRIPWMIDKTIMAIKRYNLPEIYERMYQMGKKLN